MTPAPAHPYLTYEPPPEVWPAWETTCPEVLTQAASQSCKTTDGVIWLAYHAIGVLPPPMRRAIERGERRIGAPRLPDRGRATRVGLLVVPSFPQGLQGAVERLREWIPRELLYNERWSDAWSKGDHILRWRQLPNRPPSLSRFVSVEQGLKGVEGGVVWYVLSDEDIERGLQASYAATMSSVKRGFLTQPARRMRYSLTPYECARQGGVSYVTENVGAVRPGDPPVKPGVRPDICCVSWELAASPLVRSQEAADRKASEMGWTGWEYTCRIKGRVVSQGSAPAYDPSVVEAMLREAVPMRAQRERGVIVRGEWVPAPDSGSLYVWERPVPGDYDYCAGSDLGEGVLRDESTVWIKRRRTGKYVALIAANNRDPAAFADLVAPILRWYGHGTDVPLNPERNGPGQTFINVLRREHHYSRLRVDRREATADMDPMTTKYGFLTDENSRDRMINLGRTKVRERKVIIPDEGTLYQLRGLNWDVKTGRWEHAEQPPDAPWDVRYHDDRQWALVACELMDLELPAVRPMPIPLRAQTERGRAVEKNEIERLKGPPREGWGPAETR